ncbi:MFS transporter [Jannaschia sp. R86511]|uniref:MFS transporter n=1 Tax=Jannaschia sp. R86511 TaxID=3093853 RepID=UPI0036D23425
MSGAAGRDPRVQRARWAVGTLFLTNGALIANVVPRYPDLVARLDLSRTELGGAVAAYGVGALVLGLTGGVLVHRFGSARVALGAVLLASANLALVGVAGTWLVLAGALLLAGAVDAVADVAENTHGLRVERLLGRSVLNTMHAMWSVGAVLGGSLGSLAAALDVPVQVHLPVAGALVAAVGLLAYRRLLPGPDRDVAPVAAPGAVAAGPADGAPGSRAGRRRETASTWSAALPLLVALGLVASSAQLMEETTATWSALYLRGDLAAGAGAAGLGFVALQGAQFVGRLLGDPAVTRWGDVAVARVGGLLALVAMGTGLALADQVQVTGTVVAFALVGLGIGTVIPSAMRRADEVPGLRPGTGLTLASTVLRVVVTVAPLALGVVADAFGERAALTAVPLSALLLVLMAGVLAPPRPVGGR